MPYVGPTSEKCSSWDPRPLNLWISMDYLVTTYSKVSVPIKLLPGHFGQCVCVISLGYSRRSQTSHNTWRCGVDRSRHRNALNKDPSASAATEPGWISNKVIATVPIWSKCKHTWASMLTMLFMRYLCLLISPCMMPAVSEGKELRLLPAPPTRLGGWILQGLRWGNRWRSGGGELPHSLWLPLGFQALNLSVGQKGQATTWVWNKRREPSNLFMWKTAWRTKLLTTRNGHGKSGWSPIGCEGLYFHAMCKNRISDIDKWVVLWRFSYKSEHPKSTPYFSLPLVLLVKRLLMCRHHSICVCAGSILAMRRVTQYTDRRHKRSKWTSGCRCRLGNLGKTCRHISTLKRSNLKGFDDSVIFGTSLPCSCRLYRLYRPSLCNSSTVLPCSPRKLQRSCGSCHESTAVTSGRLRSGCA